MSHVLNWLKSEPVRAYSILLAIITVATTFGLDLSTEQTAAVLALAAVILGVGSQAVRATVTPAVNLETGPPPPEA